MEVFTPSHGIPARVRQVVEDAAGAAIADGRARLAVTRLANLIESPDYDCPVIVLTPANPEAARLAVEVQLDDLWWVHVADGPGSELHDRMKEDRYALLASMVRSVIEGRYRTRPLRHGGKATSSLSATVGRVVRNVRHGGATLHV